ncbi:MAG: hypothetical protein LAO09_03390 [Acidobacteriia bacterium]|nr:hypothetical protein [Terriglobia bacterium]
MVFFHRNNGLGSKFICLSRSVSYRAYSDFLIPDRLGKYHALIGRAIDGGYQFHSLIEFWQHLQSETLSSEQKCIVLRHDVDADSKTARRMWELELRRGVQSSYYFRKSTLDIPLMQEIQASGCEASYHYEELATLARKKGFTRREQIEAVMPHLRELFRENLHSLREATGLPMLTVASHGDFINRKLGIPNHEMLKDDHLRRELNVVLEAYDSQLMQHVTTRCSDSRYPPFWSHGDPEDAIFRGEKRLYILIHPRQWHASVWLNLKDDTVRCWEGLSYWRAAHRHSQ